MEKIRTTVRVAGKEYTIASYDPQEHVQRVAAYVDRKMNELNLATRLPSAQLAVLTAVNVTDDMLKAQDEVRRLRRELGEAREQLEKTEKLPEEITSAEAEVQRLREELDKERERRQAAEDAASKLDREHQTALDRLVRADDEVRRLKKDLGDAKDIIEQLERGADA